MMQWIAGLNGVGKTVFLEQKLNEAVAQSKEVVTNLRKVHYKGFDEQRLRCIKECE